MGSQTIRRDSSKAAVGVSLTRILMTKAVKATRMILRILKMRRSRCQEAVRQRSQSQRTMNSQVLLILKTKTTVVMGLTLTSLRVKTGPTSSVRPRRTTRRRRMMQTTDIAETGISRTGIRKTSTDLRTRNLPRAVAQASTEVAAGTAATEVVPSTAVAAVAAARARIRTDTRTRTGNVIGTVARIHPQNTTTKNGPGVETHIAIRPLGVFIL